MMESDERREVAKWEAAVEELLEVEFIAPVGYKGELFEMTAKGYDYLDVLTEEQNGMHDDSDRYKYCISKDETD